MADISKIMLPDGTSYDIKDSTARSNISGKAPLASPAFTGTPTAPTAADGTNSTQIATTAFVMNAFKANDAMIFKGTIGSSGATVTSLPATHYQGWTYRVITAGTYAGQACEIGDMIICITDGTTATDSHWTVVQSNIDGVVIGPASATDAHVAVFDGTTGKLVKDSGFTIGKSVPSNAVFTDNDTKNTAGTTNKASTKMFIAGATSQAANPQTFSNSNVYIGTDNHVYSNGKQTVNLSDAQALTNKTINGYTPAAAMAKAVDESIEASSTSANLPTSAAVAAFVEGKGYITSDTDTKNTAGATDSSEKLYLIGATSQGANPQTYSQDTAYVGTDGCLYSGGTKVLTSHQNISGKKNTQTAVTDPTASGNSITFIDSISQNTQGVITPTKKTVSTMTAASSSAAGAVGLVPAPAKGDQTKFLRGDATWQTVITSHQDISGKKNTQSAVSDPTASGTSLTFISGITQNAQGVISPSKKTVATMGAASASAAGTAGLVPAPAAGDNTKYLRGDGVWQSPISCSVSDETLVISLS